MEWKDINKELPPKIEDGILALYMPKDNDGNRVHDITQVCLSYDNCVAILWYWEEGDNKFWFVGHNPSIRFYDDDIKKIIGWWSYLPQLNQPERSKREESLILSCNKCDREAQAFRCVHCDELNYK